MATSHLTMLRLPQRKIGSLSFSDVEAASEEDWQPLSVLFRLPWRKIGSLPPEDVKVSMEENI